MPRWSSSPSRSAGDWSCTTSANCGPQPIECAEVVAAGGGGADGLDGPDRGRRPPSGLGRRRCRVGRTLRVRPGRPQGGALQAPAGAIRRVRSIPGGRQTRECTMRSRGSAAERGLLGCRGAARRGRRHRHRRWGRGQTRSGRGPGRRRGAVCPHAPTFLRAPPNSRSTAGVRSDRRIAAAESAAGSGSRTARDLTARRAGRQRARRDRSRAGGEPAGDARGLPGRSRWRAALVC